MRADMGLQGTSMMVPNTSTFDCSPCLFSLSLLPVSSPCLFSGSLAARLLFQPLEEAARLLFSKIEPHGGKDEEGDTDSGGSTGKGAGKDAEAVLAATEEARKAEKAEKTERRRKAQGNRLVMAGVLETLLKFVVTVGLVFACFGFNYTSVRLSLCACLSTLVQPPPYTYYLGSLVFKCQSMFQVSESSNPVVVCSPPR